MTAETYRLHNRTGSGGFAVEAALAMTGADYELVSLDSKPGTPLPESFRAVNPRGQVPALIMPDGSLMTETAAILVHLAALHPDRGLGPAPGTAAHGQFLRFAVFISVNLYESVLRVAFAYRYTEDPDGVDAVRSAAIRQMGENLALLDAELADRAFLTGDSLSVVDIYLAMLYIWYRGDVAVPRVAAVAQAVRSHPVVGPIWRRHFGDR